MTLRKAVAGEEPGLLAVLQQQPLYNLFGIGNLSNGLTDQVEAWVQEGVGLLLRRGANWMIYPGEAPDRFDFTGAAAVLNAYPRDQVTGLVGRPAWIDPLMPLLPDHPGHVHHQQFAVLSGPPTPVPYSGTPRLATQQDLPALAAMYDRAGDLRRSLDGVRRMFPDLWVVEEADGQLVSAGYLPGETAAAAMVGGIFTPPEHRRKGYASTLVHAMSASVLGRGKVACLFYDNPEAGRIYRALGYQEMGPWRMVRFHP